MALKQDLSQKECSLFIFLFFLVFVLFFIGSHKLLVRVKFIPKLLECEKDSLIHRTGEEESYLGLVGIDSNEEFVIGGVNNNVKRLFVAGGEGVWEIILKALLSDLLEVCNLAS